MTLSFLSKRRFASDCAHVNQMRIEIAGLSREVCETCGKVTVSYVEEHYSPERAQALAAESHARARAELDGARPLLSGDPSDLEQVADFMYTRKG